MSEAAVSISGRAALAIGILLAILPLLLPADAFLVRAVFTGYAVGIGMKLRLWVCGDFDPGMMSTLPRRLLWLGVPQATCWPGSVDEARRNRRQAPRLLLRAAGQALLMLAVVALKMNAGIADRGLLALTGMEMIEFFLLLSALADAVAGLAALSGVRAEPVFVRPLTARSPDDFWSNRWNLVVHRFARGQLFLPAARRVGPLWAAAATFVASGLMHEYLALAAVGPGRYRPGFMLGFFTLHAMALLAVTGLGRRWPQVRVPAALSVALHLLWLMATAPLFFHPLRPQIHAFDAACLRLWALLLAALPG